MSSSTSSPTNASFAIASIWAWLIPHFYIEFSEWRLAILDVHHRNKATSKTNNHKSDSSRRDEKNDGEEEEDDDDDDDDDDNMMVVKNNNTISSTSGSSPSSQQPSGSRQRTRRRRRKKTDRTLRMTSINDSDRDFESDRESGGQSEQEDGQEDLENGTGKLTQQSQDGRQEIDNTSEENDNDSIQDVLDENVMLDIDVEADGENDIEKDAEDVVHRPRNRRNVGPQHEQQQQQQQPLSASKSSTSPPPSSPTTAMSSAATNQIQAAIHGSGVAVLVIIIVYTVSAVVVGTATREMDRKADAVVVGLGRMLSAFLFAVFSVTIPMWLGVTYSSNKHAYQKQQIFRRTTQREVAFRVAWSFLGHFFIMYGIMLLYFCNPDPMTVPLSTGIGILFGFGIVWLVWLGQTRYKKRRRLIAFLGSSTIAVASAAAFAAGCWYVKEVWYEGQDVGYQDDWTWFVFFGWLSLCMVANYVYYRLTRRKLAAAVANATAAAAGGENNIIDGNNSTADGTTAGDNAQHEDDAKSTWRYQAKLFEPPESFCGAASELSKATTTAAVSGIKALRPNFDNLSVVSGGKKNRSRANTGNSSVERPSRGNADPTSYQTPVRRRRSMPTEPPSSAPPTGLSSERANYSSPLSLVSQSALFTPSAEGAVVVGNRNRTVSNVSSLGHDEDDADPFASLSPSWETAVNGRGGQNSFQDNSFNVIDESDCESRSRLGGKDEREASGDDENNNEPSLWFMIKTNSCCGRRRYYNAQPRKPYERASNFIKWFLWTVTTGFHIYLTIVAIGATSQMNNVRAALPSTYAFLYPENYVEGTMCAWNESSPDGDIRTFDSLEEVFAANYSVIHCGACNKCSNWNDLELQWTTRTHLAEYGQECVKKSLGPGNGAEDVHQCNMELIGFTNDCSLCWTEDQMCAKTKCVWIYLQSFIVNQVSNFDVGPNDITTATCDEAICGPAFVPCSGATRRRMNIVSDIPRPADQQCTVAQHNWTEVFNFL